MCSVPPASDASQHCWSLMAEPQLNQTLLVLKFQIQGQIVALSTSKKRKHQAQPAHSQVFSSHVSPNAWLTWEKLKRSPVRDPQILGGVIWPSDWEAERCPRLGMCSAPAAHLLWQPAINLLQVTSHQGLASSSKPISG